jgi:hypothetical protein
MTVSNWLGHARVSTTERYADQIEAMQDEERSERGWTSAARTGRLVRARQGNRGGNERVSPVLLQSLTRAPSGLNLASWSLGGTPCEPASMHPQVFQALSTGSIPVARFQFVGPCELEDRSPS